MRVSKLFTRTLFIGLGIALAVYIAIHYVFSPIINFQVRTLIFWAGAPIGALIGGYYIGRQLGSEVLQGLLVGLLDLIVLLILGQIPLNPILLVLTFAAGPLGMILAQQMPYSTRGTVFSSGRENSYSGSRPASRPRFRLRIPNPFEDLMSRWRSNRHYDQLLQMVRMDRETADRLVEFERRRTPYASRETLILNAIDRIQRDRHL